MATRTGTNDSTVELTRFFADGSKNTCTISTTDDFEGNTQCNSGGTTFDCGGTAADGHVCPCANSMLAGDCVDPGATARCLRIQSGPKLALKTQDLNCYVYVAWDRTVEVLVGGIFVKRFEARVARIDVPVAGIPNGVSCPSDPNFPIKTAEAQTFLSSIAVSKFDSHVIWTYYKDAVSSPDNHCSTVFQGRIDINLDFSTEQIKQISASSFPNIVSPLNNTSGDYVFEPTLSLPGGGFLATWAGPILTSSSAGTPCQGNHYNLQVRGRTLTPQ